MIVIKSIGSATLEHVTSIYQHLVLSACPAVVAFSDDGLKVKIVLDSNTHILTAIIQETNKIKEWKNVLTNEELFLRVSEIVSTLYLYGGLA